MPRKIVTQLSNRLKDKLPGWEAQKILSPLKTRQYLDLDKAGKQAAVLALLYPDTNDDLCIIYIKRPSHNPNDKHGGQISFPGGQKEDSDRDFEHTALRECFEEIGVEANNINILGKLTPLYIYVSDFYVQPYLGFIPQEPKYILQKSEVDYIVKEKIVTLKSDDAIYFTDYRVRSTTMKNMPHYKLGDEILWGATAMITSEIVQIFNSLSD